MLLMGKLTISMGHGFHSYVTNYQSFASDQKHQILPMKTVFRFERTTV